jgi:hypothetical protein
LAGTVAVLSILAIIWSSCTERLPIAALAELW